MVDVVKNNLDKIIAACEAHQVQSLYLIGSAARSTDFTPQSDLDFLYRFKDGIPVNSYADNYFELLKFLEQLFKRRVDLVPEGKSRNRFFIQSVNDDKLKLYEALY